MLATAVRPRLVALLGAGALCAAVWPAAANAGCGEEFRQAPAGSAAAGSAPLAIGDSVLADVVPELAQAGFEADGMVCRQMSQGIDILKERGASLPHLVLLALGANGEVTPLQIQEALGILGPSRVLALVTPHGSVVPSDSAVIRSAASEHPGRIILLDWDRLGGEHPEWLAPDGVHLGGSAGIAAFAQLITSALSAAPQQPPEATPEQRQEPVGAPETLPTPQKAPAPAHPRAPAVHHSARHSSSPPASTAATTTAVAAAPSVAVANDAASARVASPSGGSEMTLVIALAAGAALLCAGALLAWRHLRGQPR
jgi:hypothetical protein